jgi:hypothetical protein
MSRNSRQRRRWKNARRRDIFSTTWKDFGGFDDREADDADDGE